MSHACRGSTSAPSSVISRAPEAGFAAVQGARLALELQLAAEARSILDAACRNGARVACERLRKLGSAE